MALCTEKGMVKLKKSVIYILLGAALWGTIGWYVKHLNALGFTAMEVVTLRVTTTAILLITYVYITSPDEFKLHSFRDIKYFLGTGIVSIIFLITVYSPRLITQRYLLRQHCYIQLQHL